MEEDPVLQKTRQWILSLKEPNFLPAMGLCLYSASAGHLVIAQQMFIEQINEH